MGILNRTPDSFFDGAQYFDFDGFLAKAEQLVDDGADFLDVGGVKAGPGPEVGTEAEELERVVPAVEALRARFDVPHLGRHLEPGRRCARRSPPAPSSATTSRASPTPTTCRPAPQSARRWSPPTSASARGSPIPSPLRRPARRRVRLPRRPRRRRRCAAGIPPRADHGRRRPRPGQDRAPVARAAAQRPTSSPRSATRCSCRRPTSGSSASCSALDVTDRREASHGGPRARHHPGLSRPAGPRRPRRPADRRRDGRAAGATR